MNQFIENLKKNPSLLIGFAILLVCVGFAYVRANQLSKLSVLKNDLNAQLDIISQNFKNSKNIDQDIQELENLVGAINERLFAAEERSTNIDFFYSFEERHDLKISEVKQQNNANPRFAEKGPDQLELYSAINYSIMVSGTFKEILQFLYEIYQIEEIVRVTEFQIESYGVDDSEDLSAKINVVVLARK